MIQEHVLVYLTPILIFLARCTDVSIGTIRIISISRQYRVLASLLGFFEIMIWLCAISQIMQNLNNWMNFVAYAGGYAMGNFIGMTIERRIALGRVVFRIIAQDEANSLLQKLSNHGYSYTIADGRGSKGPVKIIYVVCERKDIDLIESMFEESDLKVFYSIEDVRRTEEGVFPNRKISEGILGRLRLSRKGK